MSGSRALVFVAAAVFAAAAVARRAPPPSPAPGARTAGAAPPGPLGPEPTDEACAGCHEVETRSWAASQHAHAMRRFDAGRDAPPPGAPTAPLAWIGVAPLAQVLVAGARGRLQVFDPAYEPRTGAWFSIFGDTRPQPDAWGHWTRGGMTWNAQCAPCHTTGFAKRYDAARDAYASTMDAIGVGCAGCHGATPASHGTRRRSPGDRPPPRGTASEIASPARGACSACHARREDLTGAARPGEPFDRHYRLRHADEPGLYAPDGQALGEVFEAGSLALSRMGHAGVTCVDCHEPHGGALRTPNERDAICLGCHAPPARRGATPIDAATHGGHAPSSAGARCVACHMPRVSVMARDARRDHRFSSPNPVLARELGLPLACDACHGAEAPTWAGTQVARWFPRGPSERLAGDAARTRALAAAARGEIAGARALAARVPTEPNPAWRATALVALAPFADDVSVQSALTGHLADPSPDARQAAIGPLARFAEHRAALERLRTDPSLAVRLTAAWATRSTLPREGPLHDEVVAWVDANLDTPAGAIRASELAVVERRREEAVSFATRATAWDPSVPTWMTLARALAAAGRADEARAAVARAQSLASTPARPSPPRTP